MHQPIFHLRVVTVLVWLALHTSIWPIGSARQSHMTGIKQEQGTRQTKIANCDVGINVVRIIWLHHLRLVCMREKDVLLNQHSVLHDNLWVTPSYNHQVSFLHRVSWVVRSCLYTPAIMHSDKYNTQCPHTPHSECSRNCICRLSSCTLWVWGVISDMAWPLDHCNSETTTCSGT